MKKILLIGGTGMMGSAIIPLLLKKGYSVDAISLDDLQSSDKNLRYIKADAFDTEFLRELLKNGYDGIIDFLHYHKRSIFEERYRMLLESTSHYVFLSSYRVYADCDGKLTEESPRLTEAYSNDTELMTEDGYGVLKCISEDILRSSGYKNYTIVRPVVVYAENSLLLATWKGRLIPYRARQGKKLLLPIEAKDKNAAIIYAGDIARLFVGVLFNEKSFGETYTFGSPEPFTWGDMAKVYEENCGISCEWIPGEEFSKMMSGNTDKINYVAKFMLYYDRFFNRNVNVDKVMRDCGVSSESFILHKDGLKKCIASYPDDYEPTKLEKMQCEYMDDYIAKHS